MPKVNVQGTEWDVKSVDDNIVTLKDGQTLKVNADTLTSINDQLSSPLDKLEKRLRKSK